MKLCRALHQGRAAPAERKHLADKGEHHPEEDSAYFGKRKISEITTKDVIAWQNELLAYRDEQRKPYSQTYLKTLHNQLSAIFNHAVRFYELRSNPAAKAGNMGTEERKEMLFWTKAEYQRFAEAMMDKPLSYYAFEMLYWCGIREGELLALTPADFDLRPGR